MKNFYTNKCILITGHTGFKGTWLSLWLKILNASVIGASLPLNIKNEQDTFFKRSNIFDNTTCIHHECDITNYNSLSDIFKRYPIEIIFHLAAQPILSIGYSDPLSTINVNTIGTANLLECVRNSKTVKSLVIITTDKCYKDKHNLEGYSEDDELGGIDPYSSSKVAAEFLIKSYCISYFSALSIGVASARAGNIIGGGDFGVNRIVPDIMKSIFQNQPLTLRMPYAERDWSYVLDVLHGYLLLGEALFNYPVQYSSAFNFSCNLCMKVEDLAKYILRYLEIDLKWKTLAWNIKETEILRLNNTKAQNKLNWKPTYNLNDICEDIYKVYKNYFIKTDGLENIMKKLIHNFMDINKQFYS